MSKNATSATRELTQKEVEDSRLWDAAKALDDAESALRFANRPELLRKVSKLRSKVIHTLSIEAPFNPRFP